MTARAPIGIFDSGFGGLSIYRSIYSLLPFESTIYVGDHAFLPYGTKSKAAIRSRAKKILSFLLKKGAKGIVVACNTATIAGIDHYRTWFPSIPIIGVVPVIKTAAAITKKQSVAVLATPFTAKSVYQRKLIATYAPGARVYSIGCPHLLTYVERGELSGTRVEKELRSILTPTLRRKIDVVALGCTHYPFLETSIRAIVGDAIKILDSGGAVARQLQRILYHNGIAATKNRATHLFYSTDELDRSKIASTLLGEPVQVTYAHI